MPAPSSCSIYFSFVLINLLCCDCSDAVGTLFLFDSARVCEIAGLLSDSCLNRSAIVNVQAALLAERLTGDGVVKSMELATGIPLWEIDPFLGFLVLGLLVAAFFPSKSEQSQFMQTARAAHEKARSFGKNVVDRVQSLIGRLACFGLAGSIVAEVTTGQVRRATADVRG